MVHRHQKTATNECYYTLYGYPINGSRHSCSIQSSNGVQPAQLQLGVHSFSPLVWWGERVGCTLFLPICTVEKNRRGKTLLKGALTVVIIQYFNPLPDKFLFCGGHFQPIHQLNLPYPQFCWVSAPNFTQVLLQPSSTSPRLKPLPSINEHTIVAALTQQPLAQTFHMTTSCCHIIPTVRVQNYGNCNVSTGNLSLGTLQQHESRSVLQAAQRTKSFRKTSMRTLSSRSLLVLSRRRWKRHPHGSQKAKVT